MRLWRVFGIPPGPVKKGLFGIPPAPLCKGGLAYRTRARGGSSESPLPPFAKGDGLPDAGARRVFESPLPPFAKGDGLPDAGARRGWREAGRRIPPAPLCKGGWPTGRGREAGLRNPPCPPLQRGMGKGIIPLCVSCLRGRRRRGPGARRCRCPQERLGW